ncbi:MAG: glycosyltransferase family 4 protein [Longimicrobiales bacterium]
MRLKVLHLIDTGGPGGAETVFRNVVTGLDSDRWESLAVVPVRDWLHDALRTCGVEPLLVSTHGSFDLAYLRRLIALCRTDVSLIHAHLLTTSVYGALAGAIAGVPLVCTFHGPADIDGGNRLRTVKFRIINNVGRAHVVFVSESLRRTFLETVPLNAGRTAVVPNGIEADRFGAGQPDLLRQELDVGADDLLIGAVGNVRPSKSYDVLLRSAALLRARAVPFRMAIVGQGDGPLLNDLRRLHAELGLGDTVAFTGFREDIPAVMRSLDIYVSSSTVEGFSLTTVEAMAAGVPVVATRSGGPEDIIRNGETGVLVPARSPEALADALEALTRDTDGRHRLAGAAKRVAAERYTIDAMVRGYEHVYERALVGPRGTRQR